MTFEQDIHDFVDGILDPLSEDTLFAALHFNEHLRKELKYLLLIQRSVASDTIVCTPSPQTSQALFNTLGFSTEPQSSASFGSSHLFSGVIGGIIGVLLMVGFSKYLFLESAKLPHAYSDSWQQRPINQDHLQQNRQLLALIEPSQDSIGQLLQLPQQGNTSSQLKNPNVISYQQKSVGDSGNSNRELSKRHQIILPLRNIDTTYPQHTVDTVLPRQFSTIEDGIHNNFSLVPQKEEIITSPEFVSIESSFAESQALPSDHLPVRLEFRKIESRPFASVPTSLAMPPTTLLANSIISGYWVLNNQQEVGIEFGQEQSLQRYRTKEDGNEVEVIQNPVTPWGGIIFRQRMLSNQLKRINPYAQISLGATEFGPIARLTIAGDYEFLPELRMIFGAELSNLGYMEEGVLYLSPRYGITYGLSGNF